MKLKILAVLLVFSCFARADSTYYDNWVRYEGYYLLTDKEKEKFRSLSDTEKELYIRNLWDALDPDPLTPENEFKVEYEKRIEYVKKHFGIPSDRANVYLLLGAPTAVENHDNSDKYYPLELWSYYSLGVRGLPPSLELIFFKPNGAGNFRLYSPLFDGFKALTPTQADWDSPRAKAQMKAMFDPEIVDASEHFTVGASSNESEEIRLKLSDPGAIRRFQSKQRPTVETTVVYQSFEADVHTYSIPYEGEAYRTSIAITIPPKYLTFEKSDNEYRGRIDMVGKITDEKGHEIVVINDSPALKLNESDFEKAHSFYFTYQFDAFLLPGKYTLDCLYRDYVTNLAGKLEKTFEIKPPRGDLDLTPLLLAFKTASSTIDSFPFVYGGIQYYPKENSTFNDGQMLFLFTSLMNPKKMDIGGFWKLDVAISKDTQKVLELTEDFPLASGQTELTLTRRVKLESIPAGSYVVSMKLTRGDLVLTSEAPIKITADPEVLGRLRVQQTHTGGPEGYHTNLALQLLYQGKLTEAALHDRIALDFAPSSYPARSLSARIDQAKGNTDAAIAAYEKLVQESTDDKEGFYLIGKWSLEKQQWQKALDNLKQALALGYYTADLLNCLAKAEIGLGHATEAVGYLEKSLALNSNQPEIQQLLGTYKK
jgi:GWxTD domain-containing protein